MIVAIPQDITAAGKDYLLEKGYELKVGTGDGSPEAIGGLLRVADALLARGVAAGGGLQLNCIMELNVFVNHSPTPEIFIFSGTKSS